jgi:hypothetical protein
MGRYSEDFEQRLQHVLDGLREAIQFASDKNLKDHNAGMWHAALREMEEFLENEEGNPNG